MTRYTVVWDHDVENALANTWITSDSETRSALTAIADWLDTELIEDPDVTGRDTPERSARVIEVPLSVATARAEATYQVIPNDRMVRIIHIVLRRV